MIRSSTVLTIGLMALVTYLTRTLGYLALRGRVLNPRAQAAMLAAPGCVLIAVIAPYFVSDRPADLAALAVTLAAASRLPMLPTVVMGIAAAGLFRHLVG
jgi:uncharacterized membrane protein